MSKLKHALLIGAIVAVGAVGVTAIGTLKAYDNATKIDRSHPEVVVGEFVEAYLNRREDARAELFSCHGFDGLSQMVELRRDVESEEVEKGTKIQIVLGRSAVSEQGRRVATELELRKGTGPLLIKKLQYWQFELENHDGWRVCSAQQIAEPTPTPTPSTQPITS